jgi:hypothetical protein
MSPATKPPLQLCLQRDVVQIPLARLRVTVAVRALETFGEHGALCVNGERASRDEEGEKMDRGVVHEAEFQVCFRSLGVD